MTNHFFFSSNRIRIDDDQMKITIFLYCCYDLTWKEENDMYYKNCGGSNLIQLRSISEKSLDAVCNCVGINIHYIVDYIILCRKERDLLAIEYGSK